MQRLWKMVFAAISAVCGIVLAENMVFMTVRSEIKEGLQPPNSTKLHFSAVRPL